MATIDYDRQLGKINHNANLAANEVIAACNRELGRAPKQLWGWGPNPDHNNGRCVDFMVYGDKEMGDFIANYLWTHRERLGLQWVIWYQRIRSTTPGKGNAWRAMADRGNGTANHKDHPHAQFSGKTYKPPVSATTAVTGKPFSWRAFRLSARLTKPVPTPGKSRAVPESHLDAVREMLVRDGYLADETRDGEKNRREWTGYDKGSYARFQKSIGLTGKDADGIPGVYSLNILAKRHGYTLTEVN